MVGQSPEGFVTVPLSGWGMSIGGRDNILIYVCDDYMRPRAFGDIQ